VMPKKYLNYCVGNQIDFSIYLQNRGYKNSLKMRSKRRDFLKTISALPMVPLMRHGIGWSDFSEGTDSPLETSLQQIGKIKIKTPWEIAKSPFGIGCETLDRELWDPKEIYPWMNDLSVKWARLQTGWARVEKEKGKYDWEWLDESVDGLIDRGFKPFFNVGYGNLHYTEGDMGYHPLLTDHALKGWKNFVVALAQRYKNKITHYEIWNEPNLAGFWKPDRVNPSNYVRLFKETAPLKWINLYPIQLTISYIKHTF